MRSPCWRCVCLEPHQLLDALTNLYEIWYICIVTPEPISTAYFMNTCHQSVYDDDYYYLFIYFN
jgi:hypothetical protein